MDVEVFSISDVRLPVSVRGAAPFVSLSLQDSVTLIVFEGACSSGWLERTPDKREVGSSSLPRPTTRMPDDMVTCHLPSSPASEGAIAQLGERLLCKQEVVGSIPSGSTNLSRALAVPCNRFGRTCAPRSLTSFGKDLPGASRIRVSFQFFTILSCLRYSSFVFVIVSLLIIITVHRK